MGVKLFFFLFSSKIIRNRTGERSDTGVASCDDNIVLLPMDIVNIINENKSS